MPEPTLFDYDYSFALPDQDAYPLNIRKQARMVKEVLLKDIAGAKEYLIITGFTSLSFLIAIFGANDYPALEKLRILIGFDPDERVPKKLPHYSLPLEVKNYWLKQNVSIRLCGPILNIIEKIKDEKIEFKAKDRMHAKLYVSDKAAILGSSNFSHSGTTYQFEANVRVQVDSGPHQQKQYKDYREIAEYYYREGIDFNQELIDLLSKLLKEATWQEALARAISEILDNKWMKDYPELYNALITHELWPSQKIGIARAMKIIQDQGRVLIADPTGSGKTKLVTALAYTIHHWMWENGARIKSNALIICPKQVIDNWQKEEAHFNYFNKIDSMGRLSLGKEKSQKLLQKEILNTDLLIIDEAHNYLHPGSLRSRAINPKGSTNIILTTATPINKKPEDLLRLIELLDLDNLSDEDLATYMDLRKKRKKKIDPEHIRQLRNYITKFIVRRTKKELNSMIEREPQLYRNSNGLNCKYPKAISEIYKTAETEEDKRIMVEMYGLTSQLKGVHYLQDLQIPEHVQKEDDKKALIKGRFKAAHALAAYMVHSALRSSRCALVEYLHGTASANHQFKLKCVKNSSGNIIHKIENFSRSIPKKQISDDLLSEDQKWLFDDGKYAQICKEEMQIYQRLNELAGEMSDRRERGKARELIQKANKFHKILAFDSTVITLDYLQKLIAEEAGAMKTIVATGHKEGNKNKVKDSFQLGNYTGEPLIALCSDAMSEGINLQSARALVMLDIPSVLRIAEQRIGRLERMDSEHKEIFIFWPDDSDEFSLKRDVRLIDILRVTEDLIGNNVEIPEELYKKHLKNSLTAKSLIKAVEEYTEKEMDWEGVKDSTQFLYGLKDGKEALIDEETYNSLKDVDATVKTAISFVESDWNWSFFCFRGTARHSPKWLFIEDGTKAYTDFGEISQKLRKYLSEGKIIQRKWKDVEVNGEIKRVIRGLRRHEKELLPWKKKRALAVGEKIIRRCIDNKATDAEKKQKAVLVLQLLSGDDEEENLIDLDHLADLWLGILIPELDKMKQNQGRKRTIYTLKDLARKKDLSLSSEQLDWLLANCQYANTLDEMIAACIIGIRQ